MAHKRVQLDGKTFACSICLDLLKDPITLPCGDSYCKYCINIHWDEEDEYDYDDGAKIYSCPQCKETFVPRPVLVKNILLADLVKELKKTGLQAALANQCYAKPEDVACDVCDGRKLKAHKSCLVCLVSYCDQHLQPHYESPAFEKHKLVDPYKELKENFWSRQDEVMKMFSIDDHDTVLRSAAERTERQSEIEEGQQNIQQRIQDREKDLKMLPREAEAIIRSADEAVEDIEKIFTELIRLVEKRRSDVKQQVRSQQETQVRRVKQLQEKLQQEITELKFSDTEDHNQFHPPVESTSSIDIRPLCYFDDVTAAVSEVSDELQDVLREGCTNISQMVTDMDVLLSQPEPKTRAEFLKYSCEITLDPNTAHPNLGLFEGDRGVLVDKGEWNYPHHPDRCTTYKQILSRESLTGQCYWEVYCTGEAVQVAVAYKNTKRDKYLGDTYFGFNTYSWFLDSSRNGYRFFHNRVTTPVSGPPSSRIGVYLDHSAGILSFYSITDTMTLLHRVQTTFTQPLYAGFWLIRDGSTAEICELK